MKKVILKSKQQKSPFVQGRFYARLGYGLYAGNIAICGNTEPNKFNLIMLEDGNRWYDSNTLKDLTRLYRADWEEIELEIQK